jgi:GNAT superfamily N-acetyltransferase
MLVAPLASADVDEIVDAFSDAFHDYPVMRFVLLPDGDGHYDIRLRRLVELFVSGRAHRNDPMFGLRDPSGTLIGAATMTRPTSAEPPASFLALRDSIWSELGPGARARYEAFSSATQQFTIPSPHHHLNMIGVRRAFQGRGLARVLLAGAHDLARSDPDSSGVTLTTELPANVRLYEHFGYRVYGHARVGLGLETWTLYRAHSTRP